MKRLYHSWDEVMGLREVRSLKKLHHPNVVRLREVIRESSRLYFVFEYLRNDLLGLMRERPSEDPFPESWIRGVILQLLQVYRLCRYIFFLIRSYCRIFAEVLYIGT